LERGAQMNIHSWKWGQNLLHILCESAFGMDLIKRFCDQHPQDINSQDWLGHTPIVRCVSNADEESKENREEIIKYLMERGAETDTHDKYNHNLLHHLCEKAFGMDLIKQFCDKYPQDINSQDKYGITPIIQCASYAAEGKKQEREEIIKYLLKRGAQMNIPSPHDEVLLHYLCRLAFGMDLIKRFCDQYPQDINAQNKYGRTPIMECAYWAHEGNKPHREEIIKYLMERGAVMNIYDEDDENLLHYLCRNALEWI